MQSVTITAILGTLSNWGSQGARSLSPGGYAAGVADHYVLSPLGLHWADPDRYAGDWFMAAAPQPHWFFDLLTYTGSSLGHLSITYFLFWVGGLLAFGLATTLLVRHWTPRSHWLNAIVFTVVMSTTPWALFGTGTSMISYAIPAVVSGNFVFLFAALLLTGRVRAGAAVASLVAVVHVQNGAVTAVILVCVLLADRVRTKSWNLVLVAGTASNVAIVAFGLWLRPVAANPEDFIEICDRIIPYHCAAYSWTSDAMVASVALIVLALTTVAYTARSERGRWMAIVGLPAVGLLVGLLVDHFQVPVLGQLAQSTNVYRLGALIAPFAIFGLLVPLMKPLGGVAGLFFLLGWTPVMVMSLQGRAWQLDDAQSPLFLTCLGLCAVAVAVSRWTVLSTAVRRSLPPLATAAFAVTFVVSAIVGDKITVRGLDIIYVPDDSLRSWGQQVEDTVPPGEQLLAPPLATYVRAATYRGVVADCKNIPYGGDSWREWNDRIEDLGGWEQCVAPFSPWYYNNLSPRALDRIAEKYDVHYLVLEEGQLDAVAGLERFGWRVVLGPHPGVNNYVMSDVRR